MRYRNLLTLGAVVLLGGACTDTQGAAQRDDCVHVVDESTGRTSPACLPTAPESARVDRATPVFTHPTPVTNPLHPSSRVRQTIYGGQVDGSPFRTEVTVLPDPEPITWAGHTVPALAVQYVAYADGRIEEATVDWFAQADDGAVWYLGEDVSNYDDGVVRDTEGTWQAGKGGAPGAMIMPGQPRKGDVYRTENLPGVVFEEVRVTAVDQTVDGPYGKVEGAITVHELHMDGSTEDKVYAPGYGEFSTGGDGDLEAVSLAVPTDAKSGAVPGELGELEAAARAAQDGAVTTADVRGVRAAWSAYRAVDVVPALLERQLTRDVGALEGDDPAGAALRVAQDVTDLRLRYEGVRKVDRERFAVWARQLGIDARDGDAGAVAGDVSSLELVWERLGGGTYKDLEKARDAADRGDLGVAGRIARALGGPGFTAALAR
ncbi:hypothetical protein [Streptomyces justiciae]|uniref:hypothetical protein n=1 Tax=Streptomyces justiciae TaxID=2780140 RepID=UPI0021185BA5|nr:hypothetical protein [Streptomyces justiciae]MCW8381947.1 hypothetical protein [Streptomyces justiciae]